MTDEFLYFAYGSNMFTPWLQARTPSARFHASGHVTGYRLAFDKASEDGSSKCDMEPSDDEGRRVDGVLFWISSAERRDLDKAEGPDYCPRNIDVLTDLTLPAAVAYFALPTSKDQARRPYHWYKGLVIAGATENSLRPEYIAWLHSVESQADPDPTRKTRLKAEALLPEHLLPK